MINWKGEHLTENIKLILTLIFFCVLTQYQEGGHGHLQLIPIIGVYIGAHKVQLAQHH